MDNCKNCDLPPALDEERINLDLNNDFVFRIFCIQCDRSTGVKTSLKSAERQWEIVNDRQSGWRDLSQCNITVELKGEE